MPKTVSSRAEAKIKSLRRRISQLRPEFRRKLTGDSPVASLFEGLRATGGAIKGAFNAKKVDALEAKIKKLEAAQEEVESLKSTKRFMAGDDTAKMDGKMASLLRRAEGNK
jgi:hypothetical protein